MTNDPRLALRVTRLENDRDSIFDLLEEFRSETRSRFDQVDSRLDQLEGGIKKVLRRLPEAR